MLITELEHQCGFMNWCRTHYSNHRLPGLDMIHSIPNGAHVSKANRNRLKMEGLKNGMPDLFLPVPMHGKHGLWIEMKKPAILDIRSGKIRKRKGETSAVQKLVIMQLNELGYTAVITYGKSEAIAAVLDYYQLQYDSRDLM